MHFKRSQKILLLLCKLKTGDYSINSPILRLTNINNNSMTYKKILFSLIAFLSIFSLFFSFVQHAGSTASVAFSEFSSNGDEWVELFNVSGEAVSLDGWKLQYSHFNGTGMPPVPSEINLTGSIPAGGLLVFNLAPSFLDDTGGSIALLQDSNPIGLICYGDGDYMCVGQTPISAPGAGQSTSSSMSGTWTISTPTKGWFNNATDWTHSQLLGTDSPTTPPTLSSIASDLASGNSVLTNMASIADPSAATGLYFTKVKDVDLSPTLPSNIIGSIAFSDTLNLTDQNVVNYLKSVGNKLDISGNGTAYAKIGLNTYIGDTSDESIFKNKPATITMGQLTELHGNPNLVVKDNGGTIINPSDGANYPEISNQNFNDDNNTFTFTTNHFTSFETAPEYNGNILGFVGAEGMTVSGYTTGDIVTTISGSITGGVPGQSGIFEGKISGGISGDMIGKINYNGCDTLSAEITNTGALGYVYLIAKFAGEDGHFEGKFITRETPINFTKEITISGENSVTVGNTLQLTATTDGENQAIAWCVYVNDESKASISETTGILTPIKSGKVTVIASALDGSLITKNFDITVVDDTPPTTTVAHTETATGGTITYTFSEPVELRESDKITVVNPSEYKNKLGIYNFEEYASHTPGAPAPNTYGEIESAVLSEDKMVMTITYTGHLVRHDDTGYIVDAWGSHITDLSGNKMIGDEATQKFTINGDTFLPAVTGINHDIPTKTITYLFSEPIQLMNSTKTEIVPSSAYTDSLAIYELSAYAAHQTGDPAPAETGDITSAVLSTDAKSITIVYTGDLVKTEATNYVIDAWGKHITDLAGNKMPFDEATQIIRVEADITGPTITVKDGISIVAVKEETINLEVSDDVGVQPGSAKYAFSPNIDCESATYDQTFVSGENFSIAGDHADYLCTTAKDNLGNATYYLVGQLHTDNTNPILAQVTPVPTPTDSIAPSYTFSSNEAGLINFFGSCTNTPNQPVIAGNNTTTLTASIGVHSDCSIKVTDTAGNTSELAVNSFTVVSPAVTFANNYTLASGVSSFDSAIDSDGNIYTVYDVAGVIYIKKNRGDAESVATGSSPAIAIDSANNIHIIYTNEGIQYRRTTGGVWGSETAIAGAGSSYDLDVDNSGFAHVVYLNTDSYADVMYATNTSGNFISNMIYESNYSDGTDRYFYNPVIKIDNNGSYHIAAAHYARDGGGGWTEHNYYIVYTTNSTSSGGDSGSFGNNGSLALTKNAIAIDENNNAKITYTASGKIYTFPQTEITTGSNSSIFYKSGTTAISYVKDDKIKYIENSGQGFTYPADLGDGSNPVALLGSKNVVFQNGADIKLSTTETIKNSSTPTVSGVNDGGQYNAPVTISFGADAIATLNGNPFIPGTKVSESGNYILIVTNEAGEPNTATVNFIIDADGPTYTIVEGVSTTPVKSDEIRINVSDVNGFDANSAKYGFSDDDSCNSSDTLETPFKIDTVFIIGPEGDGTQNNDKYLCVTATDNAGNTSYQLIGKLNIDNISPTLSTISPTTPIVITPNSEKNPVCTFYSSEIGTISFGGTCSSSSSTLQVKEGNNDFLLNSPLEDGKYTDCTITVTDLAGNVSLPLAVNEFEIDTTKPSGFTISIDQSIINSDNKKNLSFTFANAEIGTGYYYSINDNDPATPAITASDTIDSADQRIENINVSGLTDGELKLSVTLSDMFYISDPVQDTVIKEATPPTVESINVTTPDTIIYNFSEAVELRESDKITKINPSEYVNKLGIYDLAEYIAYGSGGPVPEKKGTITSAVLSNEGKTITITYTGLTITTSYIVDAWGSHITDLAGNKMLADEATQSFDVDLTAPTVDFIDVHNEGEIIYYFSEPLVLRDNSGTEVEITADKFAIYTVDENGDYGVNTKTPNEITNVSLNDDKTIITISYDGLLQQAADTSYVVDAWGYRITDAFNNKVLPSANNVFSISGDPNPPTVESITIGEDGEIIYQFSEPVELRENDNVTKVNPNEYASKLGIYSLADYAAHVPGTPAPATNGTIESAHLTKGGRVMTITYSGSLVKDANTDYIVDAWGYRITDKTGNKMVADTTTQKFTIPGRAFIIMSSETQDLDGNGHIDALKITFSKNVDDDTVDVEDFNVGDYYSNEKFSPDTNNDIANDNVIYITFDEFEVFDTDATPSLGYTNDGLRDMYGKTLNTEDSNFSVTDKASAFVRPEGDGSTDVTISKDASITLRFSEKLTVKSQRDVEKALSHNSEKKNKLEFSWLPPLSLLFSEERVYASDATGEILTITAKEDVTFANDVIVDVLDEQENESVLLLINSSLLSGETEPDETTGNATSNNTNPEVIITNPVQPVVTTILSGTTAPTINVSSFIDNGTGVLPQITINSANANNTSVEIPADTTITSADASWDGIIAAPTITTVTVPNTATQTMTTNTAIEVGFTGAKLSFDKAVRLVIPGQAGKRAGYIRTGTTFTEITTICADDTQATNDLLPADAECKMDVGSDLIIWTKHFTSFATFTATTTSGGSGGSSGGGSVVFSTNSPSLIIGDINNDKKIDKYDFALMMANWGKTDTNVCDLNNDKKVDKYDFALLMSKWNI
ncbi:MAG: dockerin type I domain-containing protein [Candidatus Paceibacterota bacterium]